MGAFKRTGIYAMDVSKEERESFNALPLEERKVKISEEIDSSDFTDEKKQEMKNKLGL